MEKLQHTTLWINGVLTQVPGPRPETTLLQYLRRSGLTGSKLSCGEGSCGSCTVMVSRLSGDTLEEVTMTACQVESCL